MSKHANLFQLPQHGRQEELLETLIERESFRIERIVSTGQSTPQGEWLDQDLDEWVVMLSGNAQLVFEATPEPIDLRPGDYLNILAHRRHRVEWTDPAVPTIWLAIHYRSRAATENPAH